MSKKRQRLPDFTHPDIQGGLTILSLLIGFGVVLFLWSAEIRWYLALPAGYIIFLIVDHNRNIS